MARTESRTKVAIWNDDDFKSLSGSAQHLYWLLYSQQTISLAGLIAYTPTRWACLSSDGTVAKIILALKELEERRYVVTDQMTEELFVRSFMRNDGVRPGNPKVWRSAMDSIKPVLSARIRKAAEMEVERITSLDDGTYGTRDGDISASSNGPLDTPSDGVSDKHPVSTVVGGRWKVVGGRRLKADEEFVHFWAAYPRKTSKDGAKASFERARHRAAFDIIIAGAERYRDDQNRLDEFTKHPTTWLNQGCWDDDPLPARGRARQRSGADDVMREIREEMGAVS